MKPMTIVSIAAEVAPFSKAGGVAVVTGSLPKALQALGHNVITVTPLHGSIDTGALGLEKIASNVPVDIDADSTRTADFWKGEIQKGLPVYFIDHPKYFSSHKRIYGSSYQNTRYFFFAVAVFHLLRHLGVHPDILHCHDWQSGLVPHFLRHRFEKDALFQKTKTVYTIHNLTFQFGKNWWEVPPEDKDFGRTPLPPFKEKRRIELINFAKRAILSADIINTVSAPYAEEILTKEFGQDLHRILQHRREDLFGIINGIDTNDYNPATDPGLYRTYDLDSLHVKMKNKRFLQRWMKLPEDEGMPLLGMATRITEQKGFDLLLDGIEPLMRLNVQVAILGSGEKKYENALRKLSKKYPRRFACHLKFEPNRSTQLFAGCDMYLVPSRFEPSGLVQMESLRYGAIPIVHGVGGLLETITDYNAETQRGNGFVFRKYDCRDLLIAVARAVETFRHRDEWTALMKRGMQQSFSWELPAKKYVALFRKAMVH